MHTVSKTDFILYKECPKNAWYKIHRPESYYNSTLSEFEQHLLNTGNEVEIVARKLFPDAVLVRGRDDNSVAQTQELITNKTPVIFQPIFIHDGFMCAVDILEYDAERGEYRVYEVKATNELKDDVHLPDLAFQVNLLKRVGLNVGFAGLIHLNSEFRRKGPLNLLGLFTTEDLTDQVAEIDTPRLRRTTLGAGSSGIETEMNQAKEYLNQEDEPAGYCCCVYKGRSRHCTTFQISNKGLPEYSVHDISNIGKSKKKLTELVDMGVFDLKDIPENFELSDIQKNQVNVHLFDKVMINAPEIKRQLDELQYPLYFLDYESFNPAIPRFDGFGPYMQIVFQYSLHVVNSPEEEPEHFEYLYTGNEDPSVELVKSLRGHMGDSGTVIVWYKPFESTRNKELSERLPEYANFMNGVNDRIYDLMDIFKGQHYVHKDFRGSASIKKVMPVMVPDLSYKELEIGEGAAAMNAWNEVVTGDLSVEEKEKVKLDLLKYCGLDTFAMYAIWKKLRELI